MTPTGIKNVVRQDIMNPNWKQANPCDQLIAIVGSLEGHTSNWCDYVLDDMAFIWRILGHLKQLRELEPYLRGEREWYFEGARKR